MRSFLAIELPDPVRDHLIRVEKALSPHIGKASFTKPESLHITLKFLGDVRDNDIESLVESLKAVKASSSISLQTTRFDCFPNRGAVRIIAAIFGGDEKALAGVHSAIEQRCQFLGFDREQRKYTPHATVARARPTLPPATREIVQRETTSLLPGPAFEVRDFVLMESVLKPSGSEYAAVAHFPLHV